MPLNTKYKFLFFNYLYLVITVVLFCTDSLLKDVFAQRKTVSQNQIWLGYMTNIPLSKKYSLWNDVHFVPSSFFLLRTGVTSNIRKKYITIGYAYGRLPVSANNNHLNRIEHRPWAQAQTSILLSKQLILIPRFRYDARFRQDVIDEELKQTYSFVNRVRLMVTMRYFLQPNETCIGNPFFSVSEELLLNFGKNVSFNHFDQNRLSLVLGTQLKYIQLQMGYMNRFVQNGQYRFTQNHTLLIWFTHTFKSKQQLRNKNAELDGE